MSRLRSGGPPGPEMSRRTILAVGSAASAAPALPAIGAEACLDLCRRYLVLHEEAEWLYDAYPTLESKVWQMLKAAGLSMDQTQLLPEGRRLESMQARIEANLDERRALLEKLMDREPASTEGVMACLRVARALIEPDEFPEAHRLLSWAVRGLG
ncbi:hypothetical protein P7B02_07150 [Caulobacter segnis]|uniref:hypothetical protein n=1 Tax=Caulobacter segnis TaxID=88688 RepID=UPI0024103E3F|nr:hypothetical protein [Caulobacter segnis]MDG2521316.1 hypothetical protein [Caulobacter segnis]